jgi:hypothetical protein
MVSKKSIAAQLKRIGFNEHAWGRAEIRELPNIILPNEEIFECVNGSYEGGFALLVATNFRVLLIDKKPLNYLTVEDLRFDMINEIDYNHRVFGANVDISTGNRDLRFRSYNQQRLRKLISHVQHCMAEIKQRQLSNQEGQHQHLEQINERLQAYLIAQHHHQEELQHRLEAAQNGGAPLESLKPPRPSPELSDYLLAQNLLADYKARTGAAIEAEVVNPPELDLYEEGRREIFGAQPPASAVPPEPPVSDSPAEGRGQGYHAHFSIDINPLRIAYSKLPQAMRNRKLTLGHRQLPHIPGRSRNDAESTPEPAIEIEPQAA